MKHKIIFYMLMAVALSCSTLSCTKQDQSLAEKIQSNPDFALTKVKALTIMKTGFNAGDGYHEVWIRDLNSFIELAMAVHQDADLRENLMVFFRMQGGDGGILDGFTPIEKAGNTNYNFFKTDREPRYAGHKNTVETDQESALVQAVYKYVKKTKDTTFLSEMVFDRSVADRLEWAMQYLMDHRYNRQYGLLFGATTADWGDVQPEHSWGVAWDESTHPAIDIYDNAMFLIALDNLMEIIPPARNRWRMVRNRIAKNVRKHLWDEDKQKFIPHLYLEKGSPFPADFDEHQIYFLGGTAVAIEAGLLSREEIRTTLVEMVKRVDLAGAASIGLSIYPPYPDGFFSNNLMSSQYSYQNGGDWTWFGARMIQQLIRHDFIQEAYDHIQPMVRRVVQNNGFFEWYTLQNEPRGSGTFRGEAGVLYSAIQMLEASATNLHSHTGL